MPIFEYLCRRCQRPFEQIVLSNTDQVICPNCAGTAVDKQLSVFSTPGTQSVGSDSKAACSCTPQTCGCH